MTTTSQPERSRAVFSQEDFRLIRTAVTHYLETATDAALCSKCTNVKVG